MNSTSIAITQTTLLAALALGPALSASAQSTSNSAGTPPADSAPGLVGTDYAQAGFGYQSQEGAAKDIRDYDFVANGNLFKAAPGSGLFENFGRIGLDANLTYDYLDAGNNRFNDNRESVLAGLTGFVIETWGKPFVTADAGVAWQDAGGLTRTSFAYAGTAGVEFQVLQDLTLAPFVEYQAEPRLHPRELPGVNLPDHLVDYGVEATYRLTPQWSASVSPRLDQYSGKDWGLLGGVRYHF